MHDGVNGEASRRRASSCRSAGRPTRSLRWTLAFAVVGLLVASAAARAAPDAASLRVTGMTFVGSRAGEREILLRSQVASFRPDEGVAELDDVSAVITDPSEDRSFTLTCRRVELNVDSQDFLAEGDVRGQTSDGQRYATPWVRYEHENGLLFTDAPVRVDDDTGSFRGDGFRYHVEERRFELLGNVRVEQHP